MINNATRKQLRVTQYDQITSDRSEALAMPYR